MHAKQLSSGQTFFAKWIFPALWISGFGVGTMMMWRNQEPPRLVFLIAWIGGSLCWLLGPGRLKRVRVDSKYIYVSNYLRDEAVPLALISGVTENRLLSWHPVRVRFSEPTIFGTSVVFMPRIRWFSVWSSHPVVAELKLLRTKCTPSGQAGHRDT